MSPTRDHVIATLRTRFLSASHLGQLAPGDKLPSARDVAREFGVDRRVVLAAYRWLEREGVIELRERSGIYFAPAAAGRAGDAARRADWMVDALVAGLAQGTPVPAAAGALRRGVGTVRLRAACVECNDDQVAALCAELRDAYGLDAGGVLVDPRRADALLAGAPRAAARAADLLVTTPFHAGEVKLLAERLGKPWLVAVPRADVFAALARQLAAGPAYAVVADPRFAHKLALILGSTAGARGFRALVAGRDDVAALPAGAPVYVTRLARERLARGGGPCPAGAFDAGRVLSDASARELVRFIVRANAATAADAADTGPPGAAADRG